MKSYVEKIDILLGNAVRALYYVTETLEGKGKAEILKGKPKTIVNSEKEGFIVSREG